MISRAFITLVAAALALASLSVAAGQEKDPFEPGDPGDVEFTEIAVCGPFVSSDELNEWAERMKQRGGETGQELESTVTHFSGKDGSLDRIDIVIISPILNVAITNDPPQTPQLGFGTIVDIEVALGGCGDDEE